jgi:DNA-binding NarL/FixJ family response regulator
MDKIRIILVDDHALVRDGIKSVLQTEENIEIVGEASNFEELQIYLDNKKCDIIILDISLPDVSGIQICNILKTKYPNIAVLMLSMYINEEFILKAIEAGAKGYLPKNTNRKELIAAVKSIFNGDEYFSNEISGIILKSYVNNVQNKKENNGTEELTKREKEVLKLFAEGHTNTEISDKLFISVRTVESHKNHIMQKLDLKTTVDLIKYAIKHNYIDL